MRDDLMREKAPKGDSEREKELFNNPMSRIPICLVLDTSGSMQEHNAIAELNQGVNLFMNAIKNDKIAKYAADLAIVTFGGKPQIILDFGSIKNQTIPVLTAYGTTPMDEAVTLALDLLDSREKEFGLAGVDYYQPWMVLMTDGRPDYIPAISSQRTADLAKKKKLTIFSIGIGAGADMDTLRMFSPAQQPLRLQGLKFQDFFQWLSASISRVSQSMPGDTTEIDVSKISDWATL